MVKLKLQERNTFSSGMRWLSGVVGETETTVFSEACDGDEVERLRRKGGDRLLPCYH
jgi:hypothetical protein